MEFLLFSFVFLKRKIFNLLKIINPTTKALAPVAQVVERCLGKAN